MFFTGATQSNGENVELVRQLRMIESYASGKCQCEAYSKGQIEVASLSLRHSEDVSFLEVCLSGGGLSHVITIFRKAANFCLHIVTGDKSVISEERAFFYYPLQFTANEDNLA